MRYRYLCLAIVALVSVFAFSQLGKLQVDNSSETFFTTNDLTAEQQAEFKATFGNDDFVFVLIEAQSDGFDAPTLRRIYELVERFELEVPYLLEATWIGNVEAIQSRTDGIEISDFLPSLDITNEQLRRKLNTGANDKAYRDGLISGDARSLGILLEFETYPGEKIDPRKEAPPVINSILGDFDDLKLYSVGGPMMDYMMDERTAIEAPRWMIAALLGMCLSLIFTTRSVVGVIVPALTVVLSVVWTMGVVSLLGFKINLTSILVPTLMLCVGIGDTMHVVAEFQQERNNGSPRMAALRHTLGLVTRPILLTTITTATGFLAFLATDLVPIRELGIQAAIGVWMAFLLTYLFAVPLISFGRNKAAKKVTHKADIFDRFLSRLTEFVILNPAKIATAFVVVVALAFVGMSKLVIETNTIQDLPKDDPLRKSFEYVDNQMGGSLSIEFVIDTGKPDGIKKLDLLEKVDQLQAMLDQHPLVTNTSSILDQLKQLHRALRDDDPEQYRLPTSSNQISEYLLLYESGGGRQLEKYVSFTYDKIRLQARTRTIKLGEVRSLQASVEEFVDREFDDSVKVYSAGVMPMFERIATLIKEGQKNSFIVAFFAICLVMMWMLRSIKLGLIAMIPNVLPVAITLGAMGWVGAQLNMIAMILAPMIIGVAVDDTVHFFIRYRRYFVQSGDYDAAYRKTMQTVGRPLLFTTLVLSIGFGGFLVSIFAGPRNFAWSSALAFMFALVAEFMLVPLLLKWLKPFDSKQLSTSLNDNRQAQMG